MATEKYMPDVEQPLEVSFPIDPCYNQLVLRCASLRLTVLQLASPDAVRDSLNGREKALVWKQDLRIIPLCAAIYLLCYLDRSNIGVFPVPNIG